MLNDLNIVLVGCGAMGAALAEGWSLAGLTHLTIVTPHEKSVQPLLPHLQITWTDSVATVQADQQQVIVFAVKPQILREILPLYRRFATPNTLFISVAAGQRISFYQEMLGENLSLIRSMPNLPVAFGKGMIVNYANNNVSPQHMDWAKELLSSLGENVWIQDEALFDPMTALSGSGPAYFYFMVEALTIAGEAVGLNREVAELLARQTLVGAGVSLDNSPLSARQLKENVTSPGGVTAAALSILEEPQKGMQFLLTEAIAAATQRASELGK